MAVSDPISREVEESADRILSGRGSAEEKLLSVCEVLREKVHHYDWVGFYKVDPEEERMLFLGPFTGAPTEHTRIPFGNGICGQAASSGRTFIVQDVSSETNYLSCSIDVRSEIVLPILYKGILVGELDIDSHSLSPFDHTDKALLSRICDRVAPLLRFEIDK